MITERIKESKSFLDEIDMILKEEIDISLQKI
jgi:hypothetical protein